MLRRAWSWSLAALLLLAQTLGAIHGAAHARAPGAPSAAAAQPSAGSVVAGLFKAHDDAGCRLFDQLSHGDALTALHAQAPAALARTDCERPLARSVPAQAAPGGLARAPPVLA